MHHVYVKVCTEEDTNPFDRCDDQDCISHCVSEPPYILLRGGLYRSIHPGYHTWCLMSLYMTSSKADPFLNDKHEHTVDYQQWSHQSSVWLQLCCIKSIVSSYSGACIFRSDHHYSLIKANQKYGAFFTVFHWRGRAGCWDGFMNTICDVTSILYSKVDSKWPLCLYDERRVMGLPY